METLQKVEEICFHILLFVWLSFGFSPIDGLYFYFRPKGFISI